MSSKDWFQSLQKAFPDWEVINGSGNIFYMLKDVLDKDGRPVAVLVSENGAEYFMEGNRPATLQEWMTEYHRYQETGLFEVSKYDPTSQPIIITENGNAKRLELDKGAEIFTIDVPTYLMTVVRRFLRL